MKSTKKPAAATKKKSKPVKKIIKVKPVKKVVKAKIIKPVKKVIKVKPVKKVVRAKPIKKTVVKAKVKLKPVTKKKSTIKEQPKAGKKEAKIAPPLSQGPYVVKKVQTAEGWKRARMKA